MVRACLKQRLPAIPPNSLPPEIAAILYVLEMSEAAVQGKTTPTSPPAFLLEAKTLTLLLE